MAVGDCSPLKKSEQTAPEVREFRSFCGEAWQQLLLLKNEELTDDPLWLR